MRKAIFYFSILLSILSGCGDDSFPVPPASTVASFTFTIDNEGFAPANVDFTNNSIIPEEAGDYTMSWIFGDGQNSTENSPTHLYEEPGTYDVKLTIITEREIKTASLKVVIQDPAATGLTVFFGDRNDEALKVALINDDEPAGVTISTEPVARPYSMIADTVANKLYYVGLSSGTIFRADYDGKNREVFRSELVGPAGLGIDYTNQMIYWTTDNSVQNGSIAGTEVTDFVTGQTTDPEGLFVDNTNEKVYWVTYDGGLWSKNIDGGAESELATDILGAAVIVVNNTIYCHSYDLDAEMHTIKTFDTSGTQLSIMADGMDGDVYGIFYEPVSAQIYWTDQRSGTIWRANLDGSGSEIWLSGGGRIYGLALGENL